MFLYMIKNMFLAYYVFTIMIVVIMIVKKGIGLGYMFHFQKKTHSLL